ncbi:MAG: hypothetical protein V1793_18015 [Pseudomonadota bacterium]
MPPATPQFQFIIPGFPAPIDAAASLWAEPLNGNMDAGPSGDGSGLSIGDYFTRAQTFLMLDDCRALRLAASDHGDDSKAKISAITISLEKHGAFYHPARVRATFPDIPPLDLALNCAAASPGLEIIETEYQALKKIKASDPQAPVPEVYGYGRVQDQDRDTAFFLAQWFDGFHEFHITTPDPGERIVIWESEEAISFIPFPRARRLYEKASEILTSLYNPDTFEQVFPWHHAAGDFVVRLRDGEPELRLITVRGYNPMIGLPAGEEPDYDLVLNALLVFLLNLTLRMRIDRIDGTGRYHLMESSVIQATLSGFFKTLPSLDSRFKSALGLGHDFASYIAEFSMDDYAELLGSIIDSYHPKAPETGLLKNNLKEHSRVLGTGIIEMVKKSFFIDKGQ